MKYSLGSVPYYWSKETLTQFYQQAINSNPDIIYLGETVCNKHRQMQPADWLELAKEITLHGKQIIISTLSLLHSAAELKQIAKLVDNGEFLVEAHNFGIINFWLSEKYPLSPDMALVAIMLIPYAYFIAKACYAGAFRLNFLVISYKIFLNNLNNLNSLDFFTILKSKDLAMDIYH